MNLSSLATRLLFGVYAMTLTTACHVTRDSPNSAGANQRIKKEVIDYRHIREDAYETVEGIIEAVSRKELDPSQTILLIGEEHPDLPQHIWQYYLFEAFAKSSLPIIVCDEAGKGDDQLIPPDSLNENNFAYFVGKTNTVLPEYLFTSYACAVHDLPYHAIDVPKEWFYFTAPLSKEIDSLYPQPVIQSALLETEKARKLLEDSIPLHSSGRNEKIIRDLNMMHNIVTTQKSRNTLIVTIVGRDHLTSETEPRYNLQDFLKANNKSILSIGLYSVNPVAQQFSLNQIKVVQAEPMPVNTVYKDNDFSKGRIQFFMKQQR